MSTLPTSPAPTIATSASARMRPPPLYLRRLGGAGGSNGDRDPALAPPGGRGGEWNLTDPVVLIGSGELIGIPGRGDITYPYRAHSEYFYLTNRNRPGGVLAFDAQDGWADFVEPVTARERLWSGAPTGEQDGLPLSGLAGWLRKRQGRSVACLGVATRDVTSDEGLTDSLRHKLNHVRRVKDEVELERMRAAERATAAGFAAAVALMEPGRTEREVQIELEAGFLRAGASSLAFDTIWPADPTRRCCTSRRRAALSSPATWS